MGNSFFKNTLCVSRPLLIDERLKHGSCSLLRACFKHSVSKVTARGWRRRLSWSFIYLLVAILYDPQSLSWAPEKRAVPEGAATSLLPIWLRGSNFPLISSDFWRKVSHVFFLKLIQSGCHWPPPGSHVPQHHLLFQTPFGTAFPGTMHQH